MYVILVYDCGEKRVGKMLKLCRKYLNWIQNSVFEGEVTQSELEEIKRGLKEIINKNEDSVIIFTTRSEKAFKRQVLGIEKAPISGIL